jgi:plasmid stability protein
MKRTLVQFDDETYRRLRERAFRQERSISAVVREMVAKGLEGHAGRERPTRVSQFSSVRAGRSKQGRLSPVSEKHDHALAAAFEK